MPTRLLKLTAKVTLCAVLVIKLNLLTMNV
jgi:hypothetical protein